MQIISGSLVVVNGGGGGAEGGRQVLLYLQKPTMILSQVLLYPQEPTITFQPKEQAIFSDIKYTGNGYIPCQVGVVLPRRL